jgi:hypothetical protein
MSLLTQSEEVSISSLLTIRQAANLKGASYHALRMWLRKNPEVPTQRVGNVVLVRPADIAEYVPRGSKIS